MPATLDRPSTTVRVTDLEALAGLGAVPHHPPAAMPTVADVKEGAARWVREIAATMPDLVAAHLTGGITSMSDQAPFPPGKDVDLHLIVDDCSPALTPAPGSFFPVLEVDLAGVALEAGIKRLSDYASPEAVLSNPEIAVHLTGDTVLHDPLGILAGLRPIVARDYARRGWVRARLAHEREGYVSALAMLPMAHAQLGPTGVASFMGYPVTFLTAALQVATLSPLRLGGRMLVHLRQQLGWLGELELYEAALDLLGVRHATVGQAEAMLADVANLWDRAVPIRVSPHPFGHKLHPHQGGYVLGGIRRLLDDGYHREAMAWATPFAASCTDILLTDGPPAERPEVLARRERLLVLLGRDPAEAPEVTAAAIHRVSEPIFALAERLIEAHPHMMA